MDAMTQRAMIATSVIDMAAVDNTQTPSPRCHRQTDRQTDSGDTHFTAPHSELCTLLVFDRCVRVLIATIGVAESACNITSDTLRPA